MNKRFCKVCGSEIHPLRVKVLPNTATCMEHSSETAKRGRMVVYGSGDHTYSELEVLDEETYINTLELEETRGFKKKKKKLDPLELISTPEEFPEENSEADERLLTKNSSHNEDEDEEVLDLYPEDEEEDLEEE